MSSGFKLQGSDLWTRFARVGGTAPVAIKFLQLNARGTNEALVWGTVSNWCIPSPCPISSAANTITVLGLARLGDPVATLTNTITKYP